MGEAGCIRRRHSLYLPTLPLTWACFFSAPPSNFDETDEEKATAQCRRKHIVTEEEDDDT